MLGQTQPFYIMTGLCLKITTSVRRIAFCKMMKRWIFYLISQRRTGGKTERSGCPGTFQHYFVGMAVCITAYSILVFLLLQEKELWKVFCLILLLAYLSGSQTSLRWIITYELTPIWFLRLTEAPFVHSHLYVSVELACCLFILKHTHSL